MDAASGHDSTTWTRNADDSTILASPFQGFGLDNLLSEKIFSYLEGPDFYTCLNVNRVSHVTFVFDRYFVAGINERILTS